jgi:SSS family solute:Na+ symporter
MSSWHIGLSVVATDVKVSIGLVDLVLQWGYPVLGCYLLGAWLSAVFLIPKVSELDKFFYFPQIWSFLQRKVALLAGIISAIGISDSVRRFWLEPN